MELGKRYSVAYKGLKNSSYDFSFEVDGELFAAYESKEIKDGRCTAGVVMRKESDTQLLFDVAIEGYAVCECDRCLEDCRVPIDYRGRLTVRVSDEAGEYDGDVMWVAPSEEEIDLTQYIYESIVLSLPYRRVHPEGECNPDMLSRFTVAGDAETEEAPAEEDGEPHGISEGDFNKLAALKARMQGEADEEEQ